MTKHRARSGAAVPARFEIPDIGTFRVTYDRIRIFTDVPKDVLKRALPELIALSHNFTIKGNRGKRGCCIEFTCLPDKRALTLLQQNERHLGRYRVTTAEVAADCFDCQNDEGEAKRKRNAVVRVTKKHNHQRGYIRAIDSDRHGKSLTREEAEKRGLIPSDFTIYYEPIERKDGRKSNPRATDLKIYIRREKLARGGFGDLGLRLELKLSRARAVRTCFGGDHLDDLIKADLTKIFEHNLIIEELDYAKLGRLLSPKIARPRNRREPRGRIGRMWNDEEYRAKRAAHLVIMVLEASYGKPAGPMHEEVRRTSPAQIKGLLRRHVKELAGKRSRPRVGRRNTLTMKKLEACFTRIPLIRR